jgi:hypothetical protein
MKNQSVANKSIAKAAKRSNASLKAEIKFQMEYASKYGQYK